MKKSMYSYIGTFAGIELTFLFRRAETAGFYGGFLRETDAREGIVIPEEDVTDWMGRWGISNASYGEYVISCNYACDALMKKDRLVFHGAAFQWAGRAWLFSAPSGVGKTTQLRLWKKLFPDEFEIMNGDKPVLEVTEAKEIIVHPSPWKGKENYGRDDLTAPLGGIIFLRQEKENTIRRMPPRESARKLFGRIYSTFNTEEEVLNAGRLLDAILNTVPVWILDNKGDEASALLTRETLLKERNSR